MKYEQNSFWRSARLTMREALREYYTPALHDVVVELGLRNR